MKEQILALLHAECPWRDTLHWYNSIDSTNTQAKQLAKEGAPHGTTLIAGMQTHGRGRMGRQFHSPANHGIYLSVILRPNCPPEQLMHLTCVAAVAARNAIAQATGLNADIKWINDLTWRGKKLGGILTELSCDSATGLVGYAVVGIGINVSQGLQDFPQELQQIATSLNIACGQTISRAAVAAALIDHLIPAANTLFSHRDDWMEQYRKNCITLGKQIQVIQNDSIRPGVALSIDADGGLLVQYDDGTTATVQSGEVSVRGMYGYV